MSETIKVLKRYNKDALMCNFRNIQVTCNIIRHQIDLDGFVIIYNKSWCKWYLVNKKFTSDSCSSQGIYNVYEEIGQHDSEILLLAYYLEQRM